MTVMEILHYATLIHLNMITLPLYTLSLYPLLRKSDENDAKDGCMCIRVGDKRQTQK